MRQILEQMTRMRDMLIAKGVNVFAFDLGNPKGLVIPSAISRLQKEAADSNNYRYMPSEGLPEVRQTACDRIKKRHNLPFLDPDKNIVVTRGSKAGLASLMLMLLDPGDKAIVPNPCYAIHQDGVKELCKATPVLYECGPGIDIVGQIQTAFLKAPNAKFLLLNFPHNPTGVQLSHEEMVEVVRIAKLHGAVIISDLAYDGLVFSGEPALSVLGIAGPENVAETYTISKSHNMAGNVGFVVGDDKLLKRLAQFQNFFGYGVFAPLQLGAASGLRSTEDYVTVNCRDYEQRDALLTDGLNRIGWPVNRSLATIYKWEQIPEQYESSEKFCKDMLRQAHVAIWPASGFGRGWKRYVRFALVEPQSRIPEAVEAIEHFING